MESIRCVNGKWAYDFDEGPCDEESGQGGAAGAAAVDGCPSASEAWVPLAAKLCRSPEAPRQPCIKTSECVGQAFSVSETIDCARILPSDESDSWYAHATPCPGVVAPRIEPDGCPAIGSPWAARDGEPCSRAARCIDTGECNPTTGYYVDQRLECDGQVWKWQAELGACNEQTIPVGADGCPSIAWSSAEGARCSQEGVSCAYECTPGEVYTDEWVSCTDGRWHYESIQDEICDCGDEAGGGGAGGGGAGGGSFGQCG